MSDCPFKLDDRVCAPAGMGGECEPGTVTGVRPRTTTPTLEGTTETFMEVRVKFDEPAFDEPWLECQAVVRCTDECEKDE